jgi:hypothetical protein
MLYFVLFPSKLRIFGLNSSCFQRTYYSIYDDDDDDDDDDTC